MYYVFECRVQVSIFVPVPISVVYDMQENGEIIKTTLYRTDVCIGRWKLFWIVLDK